MTVQHCLLRLRGAEVILVSFQRDSQGDAEMCFDLVW